MASRTLIRSLASTPGAIPILSVVAGLGVGAVWIAALRASPWAAYKAMFLGSMGSPGALAETLVKATPLLVAGSGLCIAFRCRFWNIGAEGQLCVGSAAFTWLSLHASMGMPLAVPLVGACVAGALFAGIAGVLRIARGANEIITTIMLNYVALSGIRFLIQGPMRDPQGYLPVSSEISLASHLPILIPGTRCHAGLAVALLCVSGASVLLARTSLGFSIAAVGANPEASRYAGIGVRKTLLASCLLSGALAGLAGGMEVAGVHFRLMEGISSGVGFVAVAVALLGGTHPFGAAISGLFLAALQVGADPMQRTLHLPSSVAWLIQGTVILFALTGEALRSRYPATERTPPPEATHG